MRCPAAVILLKSVIAPLELPAPGEGEDGDDDSPLPRSSTAAFRGGIADSADDPDHEVVCVEPGTRDKTIIDALLGTFERAARRAGVPFPAGGIHRGRRSQRIPGTAPRHRTAAAVMRGFATAEQHKVFVPNTSSLVRRVVLATNVVAETSLTYRSIRVIDGHRSISATAGGPKVNGPIELVSQASAAQRAGCSGPHRIGVCIGCTRAGLREPAAIPTRRSLRTGLAAVIPWMAALRLGDVADFRSWIPAGGCQRRYRPSQEPGAFDADGRSPTSAAGWPSFRWTPADWAG